VGVVQESRFPQVGISHPADEPLPELQMTLQVILPEKKVTSAYFLPFRPSQRES
jgi:hypothetical protein